jgi:mono/diheme cytochrome c family protein
MTSRLPTHRGAALALVLALTGALTMAQAASQLDTPAASFERGRMLYENHCVQCHTPDIHWRPGRLPMTRDELRGLVDTFRRVQNLGWTPEEVDDVVEYLNVTRYRFIR